MATKVTLDNEALKVILSGSQGDVVKDLLRRGDRVANRAKELCPVRTGRLRSSITREVTVSAGLPVCRIGTNVEYARFIHDGTGIYGPSGAPIRPTSAQYLRFTPKGTSKPVFARSVKGVKPRPFLRDALPAVLN